MKRDEVEPIGDRLKRLRLASGMSQRDLSSPGVSYAYISRIEAGARQPSVKALRKLAERLGVTVEHLETGRADEVEEALAVAGLTLADLKEGELEVIERAARAWRRVGAYEAVLRVLDDRDRSMLDELSQTMEAVRSRQHRRAEALAEVA